MLERITPLAEQESGFTLIELLVVILIIGILAAIAIPSFLNQKSKSNDASAKELARTAQTASETLATDNGGSFAAITGPTSLSAIEKTIPTAAGGGSAYLSNASGTVNGYSVEATATDGNTFTITNTAGVVSRSCVVASGASAGGCVSGSW